MIITLTEITKMQDVMTQYYSMDMPGNILEMGVTMPPHGEIAQPPTT